MQPTVAKLQAEGYGLSEKYLLSSQLKGGFKMNLSEKIYYCRKKAALSQEALAEKLGVSRQAVSKWETGDAVPEIGKLMLLANTFEVTTDWLLSEDEPQEENNALDITAPKPEKADTQSVKAVDSAKKSFKKHAWIFCLLVPAYGIYRTVSLIPVFTVSAHAHAPSNFLILPVIYAIIGVAITVGGIILTVVIKKWCKTNYK